MSRSDKYAIVAEEKWISADASFQKYLKEQKKNFDKDPYFEEVIKTLQGIAVKRIEAMDMEAISTDDMYDGPSKDSIIYMEDLDKNSKFDLEPLTEEEKCTALAPVEYNNMFDTSSFKSKEGEDTTVLKKIILTVDGIKHEILKSRSLSVCEKNKQLLDGLLEGIKIHIDQLKSELTGYSPELVTKITKNRGSNRKIKDPISGEKLPYHMIFGNISSRYIELK